MKFLLRSLLLLSVSFAFAADSWKNFARADSAYALALSGETLFVGTDGGVAVVVPDFSANLYSSANGLESSEIYGVVASDSGKVFAISSKGIISEYRGAGKFSVLNRSYVEKSSELVPGLARLTQNVLVLGFQDQIAFFDVSKGLSIITLTRIGNVSLQSTAPTGIQIRGDSLWVKLGNAAFVRKMNWGEMNRDALLADPSSWTRSDSFPGETSQIVALGDTLSAKKFPDLWNGDTSKVLQIVEGDQAAYLLGRNSVWRYDGELSTVSLGAGFPLEYSYVAVPFRGGDGGISVYTAMGDFGWSDGESFAYQPSALDLPYYETSTPFNRLLKNFETTADGNSLVGIWGFGWRLYANQGADLIENISGANASCVERYLTNYIVPTGVTVAPDSVGWFVGYWGQNAYGIAYIDPSGAISCASDVGSGKFAGSLKASWSEDGSEWILYVSSGKTEGLEGIGALDILRIRPIAETGGELSVIERETVPTPDNAVIVDMDFESSGRLWAITSSTFAYWESGMDSVQAPHKTSAFEQASLSALAIDHKDRLWLGTVGSGVYLVKKAKSNPDTMAAKRFSSRNGLLSDIVYDVSIDEQKGQVWFIHKNGATRYARTDLRNADDFMTDDAPKFKAYPNPVRFERGQVFTFENISESAVVSIYNSGAHLVRSFSGNDLIGGRLVWDGRTRNGTLVAPGLYHYIVKKGSTKKQGKILVAH